MKIKKRLLRVLADKKIIQWNDEYFTDAEKQQYEAQQEQLRKLKADEEIEPPWIFATNTEPWSGNWRQGRDEYWLLEIWLPFWQGLGKEQRENYLERWQPPTEQWREYLTIHWTNK